MNTEEIRKLLEQGKLIIGRNETQKALEAKKLASILMAANVPESEAAAMNDYAEMSDVPVTVLEARNDQLGTICRKPFPIAFCGVMK